ncbi:hypothetical protein E4K72_21110 [Oxalobacteraceae bacterium OM1]|nr:hypothetical protein E4K72_21110 [Oxalobacteraceae bacterium OM1]
MNIWIPALVAVVVQPFVTLARIAPDYLASAQPLYGIGFLVLAVVAVAAAVVLLLGIPAFLVLRKFRRDGWMSIGTAGLLLGASPAALAWPRRLAGYSAGRNWHGNYVETYVNGAPTRYAWLAYGEDVLWFGLHGLLASLVFYAVWRALDRPGTPLRSTASAPTEH